MKPVNRQQYTAKHRPENILMLIMTAKKPEEATKGIILCGIVEFYAILSLLATILMVMMYNF